MSLQTPTAPETGRRAPARLPIEPRDRTRVFAWTAAAITAIWAAVVLISVFAPDLISGTEQGHTPLPAILTWIWGMIASRHVVTTVVQRRSPDRMVWTAQLLAWTTVPVWAAATLVAVFAPVLVTGTDPTHFPIAAIVAPIAAMIVTQLTCQLLVAFDRDDTTP